MAESTRHHYFDYVPEGFVWYKRPHIRKLNAWITLYLFGNFANGYDNALFNGLQILPEWQIAFNHPTGSTLGLLGAAGNIGLVSGVPIAPFFNNAFGRRKTVIAGAIMMIGGAALQGASKSTAEFVGGRVLLGFGNAWVNNADAIMCMELAYPTQRAPIAGSYNSITNIGSIVAAAVTFGTYYMAGQWSWRIPLLLQGAPAVIQAFLVMFGPESPRWLVGAGREEEAFRTLVKYHGNGDDKDPMCLYEYEEMKRIVEEERQNNRGFLYAQLFKTPGMRKRTFTMIVLAICGQMSGNGLVSYYLNQVLTTVGITYKPQQLGLNIGLSVWNFMCGFTSGLNADKFGRRPIFLTSTVGIFFSFVGVTIASAEYVNHKTKAPGDLTVFFIFMFTGFYAWAWSSIQQLYSLEIFPTSIRATSNGLHGISQQGFTLLNQYVNPIAITAIGWKYYIVFDVLIIFVGIFIYFFLVETKGYTLEETAAIFDGVEAIHSMQESAEAQLALDKGRTDAEVVHHDLADDYGHSGEKDVIEHHERALPSI